MRKTLAALLISVLMVLLPSTTATADGAEAEIAIDAAHFPDDNFRSYVAKNCDTNQDGVLNDAEITAVDGLYINGQMITDLSGIEFFTALQWLDCSNNRLTSLDVSANTALTSLDCCYNQLTSLDTGANNALSELFCKNNQLRNLDVSANPDLYWLMCEGNHLTKLDLSNTQELSESIVSDQTAAIELVESDGIYWLDFASLVGAENTDRVTVTSVTPVSAEYTVKDGVLSTNTELTSLTYTYSHGNPVDYLTMDVTLLNMACVRVPEDTLAIDEIIFPDANFRGYIADRHDANHDGLLSVEEILSVLSIDVTSIGIMNWGGMEIHDLTGIQYFTALTSLICINNQLTDLDVSGCAALTRLNCMDNELKRLDVRGCTALTSLNCERNTLSSLKIAGCTSLTDLKCSVNELSNLELTDCTSLAHLECFGNKLTKLDLNCCPALTHLECQWDELTSLDLSCNSALIFLDCGSNHLTSLDLSTNTMLMRNTDDYPFISYNVSNQTATTAMSETDRKYRLDFSDLVGAENVDRVTVTEVTPANTPYSVKNGVLTTETELTSLTYEYAHGGPDIGTMEVRLYLN